MCIVIRNFFFFLRVECMIRMPFIQYVLIRITEKINNRVGVIESFTNKFDNIVDSCALFLYVLLFSIELVNVQWIFRFGEVNLRFYNVGNL